MVEFKLLTVGVGLFEIRIQWSHREFLPSASPAGAHSKMMMSMFSSMKASSICIMYGCLSCASSVTSCTRLKWAHAAFWVLLCKGSVCRQNTSTRSAVSSLGCTYKAVFFAAGAPVDQSFLTIQDDHEMTAKAESWQKLVCAAGLSKREWQQNTRLLPEGNGHASLETSQISTKNTHDEVVSLTLSAIEERILTGGQAGQRMWLSCGMEDTKCL